MASGSYATATSGVDKNSDITSATGSRSVSVIAKAPNSNYTDSAAGSATATVITITFASNDTGKGTVSPTSKNVISGATVATSSNNLLIKGVTSGTTTTTLATITPSAKTGYSFSSWSKTSGSLTSAQTITATFTDSTKPTVTLSSSSNLKATSQTATLKCTDNEAVTAYYWGTTEPTATTSITTTTAADLTSLKATSGLSKTISSAGTYWLGCRDAAGNWDKKSVTIYSYKVENMLQNYSGSTYTTTHYTEASNATYIAPSGTTITLTSVYTIPTGSRSGRWVGYSSGEPSTTAVTPNKTNPTLTANSTYAMWFTRNILYFKYQLQSDETLTPTTQNAAGTETYTWSTDSNNYVTRQVNSGTATNNFSSYRYGVENIDLYNYNNGNALKITKAGWQGVSGKEWKCVSGCKTANLEISHNSTPFNSSTMCDISSADCTIVVKVNWTAKPLTFANQSISKTFSTSSQTASVTAATNGTGTYTYTETSETNSGGTATSYISLSGTTITIAANTPAGTYTYKIKAKDSNSGAEKEATYTITIGKANDTVSLTAKSTPYTGSAISANTATATSGSNITYTYYSTTDCTGTALSGAPTNKGNYSVKAVSAGNNNYNSGNKCVTHTITARAVTVTATNQSKTYDGTALSADATCSVTSTTKLVSGHTVTCTNTGSQTLKGSSTKTLSTAVIKNSSGTDVSSNYTITKQNGTLTVSARAVTVTATNQSKTYDGTALSANATCSVTTGTLPTGHTVTCTNTGSVGPSVASGTKTLSTAVIKNSSGTNVSSSFTITKANGTLTIAKAPLTLKPDDKEINYGDTFNTSNFSYSGTGFVNNETKSVLGGTPQYVLKDSNDNTVTISSSLPVDEYTIILSGLTSSNYNITYDTGDFVVNKIIATCPTLSSYINVYDGSNHSINVGNNASGGTVQYRTSTEGEWTTTKPTRKDVGTTTVYVRVNATNSNYQTRDCGSKAITVNKKTVTVTAANKSMNYGASAPSYSYTVTGAIGSETAVSGTATYTIKSGSTTITDVSTAYPGEYSIIPSGLTAGSNYEIEYANGTLTITGIIVTADANGGTISSTTGWTGTGDTSKKAYPTSTATYETLPNRTRTGYTFDGWYTAKSGGTKVISTSTLAQSSNHTIYAHWTANSVYVIANLVKTDATFADTGSYSLTAYNTSLTKSGDATSVTATTAKTMCCLSSTPRIDAYKGYFSPSGSSTATGTYYTVQNAASNKRYCLKTLSSGNSGSSCSLSVTASNWVHVTKYNSSNHTLNYTPVARTGSTYMQKRTLAYDRAYGTLPTPNELEDYTFDGWWTSATGGTEVTNDTIMKKTANHMVYAHWIGDELTVTTDATGGTIPETTGWTGTGETATKTVNYGGTYGTLPTPTKEGYVFIGWYTQASGGTKKTSGSTVSTNEDHTLYAHWGYNLTANANGGTISSTTGWTGTGNTATKAVELESIYGTLPTPTRTDYVFLGWYTKSSGGTKIEPTDTVTDSGPRTIYAHWGHCEGIASGNYTAGQTVTYGGKSYTVVSDNGNNVSLAYNGTYGNGTYNNAGSYLTTNFVNGDTALNNARVEGCLLEQESGVYATSNSGAGTANKPANYYWTGSGTVYTPSNVPTYNLTYTKLYYAYTESTKTYHGTDVLYNQSIPTGVSTVSTTGNATAGGTKSVANTSSSFTFNNAGYASNGSFLGATVYHEFIPNEDLKTPSASVMPMDMYSSVSGNTEYKTTKQFKMKVCGGTYNGQWNIFTAKSATKYVHNSPKTGTKDVSYDSDYIFEFAGTAVSTTSGTANSNLVRTFDYTTNAGCSARTQYNLTNTTVSTIYYRPVIKVIKN